MLRDDARFDDGAKAFVRNRIGDVDLLPGQQISQLLTAVIFSDHTDDRYLLDKFPEVARDVGSATRVKGFTGDLDNGDWRLWRNAADFPPNELVEHKIANDQNALSWGFLQNLLESFQIHATNRCHREITLVRFKGDKMWSSVIVCGKGSA